jgi:hypothetical protein
MNPVQIPMISPWMLAQTGRLPLKNQPVRFAVGDPNALTSNSWRVWAEKERELYIACRDNFREAKVSLHASGRWRMGFTTHAIAKNPHLLPALDENRAWEVWDKPPAVLPQTITAFHLYFPTSELAVRPAQRTGKLWKDDVIFIEAGPPGKMTILTLFITNGDVNPVHESEPSFVLSSFEMSDNHYAKLVAHGDQDGNIHEMISGGVKASQELARSKSITLPDDAFGYFFGHRDNGARFVVGARINRELARRAD